MFYLFLFILGLAIGSFLNVLIDRLPKEESITGRSHCDYCKKKLSWIDLLPVLSFFYLGRRCRHCRKELSFYYPMIELLTGGAFVFVGWYERYLRYGENRVSFVDSLLSIHVGFLQFLALLGIVSCCIVIFFSDFKYQIIPDSIQLVLFTFSFLLIIAQGITPRFFLDHVLAAFIVMSPILVLFLLTKMGGMGFGDVKLAFIMGFLLETMGGFIALYIAFITGALVGIGLILTGKKKMRSKIAFGPFLITGFLIMLFFKSEITQLIRSVYFF